MFCYNKGTKLKIHRNQKERGMKKHDRKTDGYSVLPSCAG